MGFYPYAWHIPSARDHQSSHVLIDMGIAHVSHRANLDLSEHSQTGLTLLRDSLRCFAVRWFNQRSYHRTSIPRPSLASILNETGSDPVFLLVFLLALFEYIEVFYNRQRLHSTLNYVSPAAYEKQHQAA